MVMVKDIVQVEVTYETAGGMNTMIFDKDYEGWPNPISQGGMARIMQEGMMYVDTGDEMVTRCVLPHQIRDILVVREWREV